MSKIRQGDIGVFHIGVIKKISAQHAQQYGIDDGAVFGRQDQHAETYQKHDADKIVDDRYRRRQAQNIGKNSYAPLPGAEKKRLVEKAVNPYDHGRYRQRKKQLQ